MRKFAVIVGLFFGLLAATAAVGVMAARAQSARIYSISPNQAQAGANAFPIVVSGAGFAKNSVVRINGVNLETYFVSWNKLRAVVPASLATGAGSFEVRVADRIGRLSNPVALEISQAPAGNYDWSALASKLQSYISSQTPLPDDKVRGLTFMLARHGRIIYAQAFGNQTLDSVLPIASSTKMPSMLAIMTLVDEGRVNLDAPISIYLQGYAIVPPDKANITLRMLMNHTSGLSQPVCLSDDTVTLRQCVQQILNAPLNFAPGTAFSYGGGSMHVAGGVAEAVTGQSWNQFFAERIGAPLNLARYTYGATSNPRIAGGASSDAGDYMKILQTYLASGVFRNARVVSTASYYEMQIDQRRDLPIVSSPGGNILTGYSFGWWHTAPSYLQSQPAPQTVGLELSDQGAFGCTPWIDLEYNYAAIILIQRTTAHGTLIWNGVRPLIIRQMQNNP
jgi:CubicO group peptidase (beta-lactamase class C family)